MNRRSFLRSTAFAGTASLLAPFAQAQGANSQLRLAIIGVRGRGNKLAQFVKKATGCRLVLLCDVDKKVLRKRAAELGKNYTELATETDYRKVIERSDIDAVVIATPNHTHALIAISAAAAGKHVYVEKPVSHNIWEGKKLAAAAKQYGVIIQHGFQRRSEASWAEAFSYLQEEKPVGDIKLARALCYKPRRNIGKATAPLSIPSSVDYNLWAGPRHLLQPQRKKLHYDWHWQHDFGNGDLGNQAPHQIDVCRMAIGDPTEADLTHSAISVGGRLGYDDDGEWANTQLVYHALKSTPILVEVRGLPKKNMNWKGGTDKIDGINIGNIIEYEGGRLIGGHSPKCQLLDSKGAVIKTFDSPANLNIQTFVDAVTSGSISADKGIHSGHLSSSLAHIGNTSHRLGAKTSKAQVHETFSHFPHAEDAGERLLTHLDANGINLKKTPLTLGKEITFDGKTESFTGKHAAAANDLQMEHYRDGFTLPNA